MDIKIKGHIENLDYDIPFYFNPKYLTLTSAHKHFYLLGYRDQQLVLLCVGKSQDNDFISLQTAPFGGIYFTKSVSSIEIEMFFTEGAQQLKKLGFKRWIVKQPAFCYSNSLSNIVLQQNGFVCLLENFSYLLSLTDIHSLHKMEVRKLQKLEKTSIQVEKLQSNQISEFYNALSVSRLNSHIPLTVSYCTLNNLILTFPEKYHLYGIKIKGVWATGSVIVHPYPDIAYYFLPFTDQSFKKDSPMVLLLWNLIKVYKEKQFKYLDLGITSIEGQIQNSLAQFKERMGATKTTVAIMVKDL